MTIKELEALIEQGGATFKDGAVVTYEEGYQVAILYDAVYYPNTSEDRERLLVHINHGILQDGGMWFNPETNKIEVDLLTVHITNITDAKNLARHFKQKAILNWKTFESIYLEDK
jgi:hypothetical protein